MWVGCVVWVPRQHDGCLPCTCLKCGLSFDPSKDVVDVTPAVW